MNLREFLLAMAISVSAFGAEFKLPEKFLVFDPSRVLSIRSANVPKAVQLPLSTPTTGVEICAHIRVIAPPSDLDPGIAFPAGAYSQSKMPILQVPPACQTPGR